MPTPALQCTDLSDQPVFPANLRPLGAMAPYLGRRFSVEDLDDEDKLTEQDRAFLARVRAFEVSCLIGVRFTVGSEEALASALEGVLRTRIPGFAWVVEPRAELALRKYQLVHRSLIAPADLATAQEMALELYAQVVEVDGLDLSTPAGREWSERTLSAYLDEAREGRPMPALKASCMTLEVRGATYSNLRFPGVGVPFYL